ncbi:MAG TPA: aldo/keto reductase [Longimicrobiaceae bacterium]|nr:aldo/keto reductase [Longimicrobiaceae bacterium]
MSDLDGVAGRSGTFMLGGDLPVHRLGFGAMRITGEGIWGEPRDEAEARRVLRRTVELGINLIDTADSYGPHVSERLIGETLAPYPDGLVIATKAGLERAGPNQWTPNGRPEHIRRALEGSLKRLRVERIDLYQLHRIDPDVPVEESLGVLKEAQQAGQIRHVGLSEVNEEELDRARKTVPIVSVQNLYNLGERRWDGMVDLCAREGIAFIPWYPLDAGKLGERGGALERVARRVGATPSQVALAWLLRRSPTMLPIPGTGSVRHLEENAAAAAVELSEDDFRELSGG